MNAETATPLSHAGDKADTLWFVRPRARVPAGPKPAALSRFLNSSVALCIVSLASWPLLFGILAAGGWLDWPRAAVKLASFIGAVGFACAELSVVDCGRPFYAQHRQLLAAFCGWVAVGAVVLGLFSLAV